MAFLPFDPETLTPEYRSLYEQMKSRRRAQGAPFDGPYAALMNHPELCSRIEELGFYLKFQGHLPREIYQFIAQKGDAFEVFAEAFDDRLLQNLRIGITSVRL